MTLSQVQQILFSYFNLTKVSSFESTLNVFGEIINKLGVNKSLTPQELTNEIFGINRSIQRYDLEIVDIVDEITCERLFVLINTADNAISQKSKFYDDNTTQFFSKIVKDCVLSEEGNISETHCLNLTSQVKMTKISAQTILDKLIADKWLVSMNDKISLGVRTIAELQQNLKRNYPNDVKNCPFCKLITIQGYICNNCKLKCHFACLKKYFKPSKSNCVCPNCKEVWSKIPDICKTEASEYLQEDSTLNTSYPAKRKKKSLVQ